ncbi:MAG: NAD(P)H-hydrate dehydratase [Oligoflexia bacterium]|nr:NAD(P)H-hydrate dehydratase [Oligoflexia bacterium]
MRLCTPEQMREIERLTQVEFDLSDEILMETAGALAAREIQLSFLPELSRGKLAIICGPGNNGGDGLVVARHLYNIGFLSLQVFTHAPKELQSKLYKTQVDRLKKHGISIVDLVNEPTRVIELSEYNVVVDALYGIGLSRPIEAGVAQIIHTLNATNSSVISIDVPSGLCATTGKILGTCVRATMTISFGLAKPGMLAGEGTVVCGKIRILQIGFPRRLFREKATTHFAFNEHLARRWLPIRKARSHKAQNGHLLVIAGRPGMWGAAQLCSEAAYRMGVGYVTVAVENRDDALKSFIKDIGSEVLIKTRDEADLLEKKNAVVLGPGAGVDQNLNSILERLIAENFKRVVIDADGLTVLSEMGTVKLPAQWILTPHAGELSKLLKIPVEEIEQDRFYHAGLAAQKFGCLVLFKGYRTVLADHQGRVAVITSGNASLAKAGTGDVLSGFIGALLAQDVQPLQAAGTAAYFHGRLSDEWLRYGKDIKSLMPRDLLTNTPELLGQLSRE